MGGRDSWPSGWLSLPSWDAREQTSQLKIRRSSKAHLHIYYFQTKTQPLNCSKLSWVSLFYLLDSCSGLLGKKEIAFFWRCTAAQSAEVSFLGSTHKGLKKSLDAKYCIITGWELIIWLVTDEKWKRQVVVIKPIARGFVVLFKIWSEEIHYFTCSHAL